MAVSVECMAGAIAASRTALDQAVGFVITKEATLLDGMPVDQLIYNIDQHCQRKPLGYIIACAHPSIAKQALRDKKPEYERIIGIKANGSAKPPKELLTLGKPEADEPGFFANELLDIPLNFKIIGTCCGTDHRHLRSIIEKIIGTQI